MHVNVAKYAQKAVAQMKHYKLVKILLECTLTMSYQKGSDHTFSFRIETIIIFPSVSFK